MNLFKMVKTCYYGTLTEAPASVMYNSLISHNLLESVSWLQVRHSFCQDTEHLPNPSCIQKQYTNTQSCEFWHNLCSAQNCVLDFLECSTINKFQNSVKFKNNKVALPNVYLRAKFPEKYIKGINCWTITNTG